MSGGDLSNLVRRLRRFGERWPWEEPTAAMCREAADEMERLVEEVERLRKLDATRIAACEKILGRLKDRKGTEGEGKLSLYDKIAIMTIAGRWRVDDENAAAAAGAKPEEWEPSACCDGPDRPVLCRDWRDRPAWAIVINAEGFNHYVWARFCPSCGARLDPPSGVVGGA